MQKNQPIEATRPVCRLVSLRPENRLEKDSADSPNETGKVAAAIVMVALVGFACMGLFFTWQHRRAKPDSQPGVAIAKRDDTPQQHTPLPRNPRPKVPPADKVIPPPKSVEPAIPVESPRPPVEPETPIPMPVASENLPPPMIVADRPRPADLGETTRPPENPVAALPDMPPDKPVAAPSGKLPETQPVVDARLASFGTRVGFFPSAADAFDAAAKDGDKLVLVMHFGGLYEDGAFLADDVERFRRECLSHPEVAAAIGADFVCSQMKVGPSRRLDGRNTGSVVVYFCLSNGAVLHAIPGPVSAEDFLRELNWLLETRRTAAAEYQKDRTRYALVFKKAHTERYFELVGWDEPVNPDEFGGFPMQPVFGPFGNFPPFGKGKGRAFRPIIEIPGEPQPRQPSKLPSKYPADAGAQAKVHWLLGHQPLAQLKDIWRRVYGDFLKESLTP